MAEAALRELIEMLMSEKEDVRLGAHLTLAQLSGTSEGALLVGQCSSIMNLVIGSLVTISPEDSSQLLPTVLTLLTNIAVTPAGAKAVLSHLKTMLPSVLKLITEPKSRHADRACALLVNITHQKEHCQAVLQCVQETSSSALHTLLLAATNTSYNTADNSLDLLMSVFENISQLPEGRKALLDRKSVMIQRLLPFTQYMASTSRRRSAVATLHNCCFQKVDLCATSTSRERLRKLNIYLVLRELHKWETNEPCLTLLEDLVNILIRTEEEIGVDDLSSMEIPEDLRKKFEDLNKQNEDDPIPAPSKSE
ncbi:protein HGH1 homolog [Hyalella azteca]|uniref:Protein HGH1 homolog n=1 Tax=Hyalella azteca TaxID=294128 RepID=A0A8B7P0I7_HYAAZ|nr:protein HGH1 homolog [Hyalella azteca]